MYCQHAVSYTVELSSSLYSEAHALCSMLGHAEGI